MDKMLVIRKPNKNHINITFGVGILVFNDFTNRILISKKEAVDLAKEILKEWS